MRRAGAERAVVYLEVDGGKNQAADDDEHQLEDQIAEDDDGHALGSDLAHFHEA